MQPAISIAQTWHATSNHRITQLLIEGQAGIDRLRWQRSEFTPEPVVAYVDRHVTDPNWIVSKLQMYWKSRATQVYLKGPVFSHIGNLAAPVPTVRFPGARDPATAYSIPSIEELLPESEDTRGIFLKNKKTKVLEWVDVTQTGHLIQEINLRIIHLAEVSATLFLLTRDEKYASFAYTIFRQYIFGIYYREEPIDLNRTHQQTISGLSGFEVILDKAIVELARIYDYVYGYINRHEPNQIPLFATAFKRWMDLLLKNGVSFNNWNLYQARLVLETAISLGDDSCYADGRGSRWYVNRILDFSSPRQRSFRSMIHSGFDPSTGIWPESPTYAIAMANNCAIMASFLHAVLKIDVSSECSILVKAVLATAQYLYPNGYTVAYGDSKYRRLPHVGAKELIRSIPSDGGRDEASLLQNLLVLLQKFETGADGQGYGKAPNEREWLYKMLTTCTFFADNASYFVQRLGSSVQNGLMIAQYGSKGNHMHANGISMELYGKGVVLAPSCGAGSSYFQADYLEYYSQYPAHNTVVVDGISAYTVMRSCHGIELCSCWPPNGARFAVDPQLTFSDFYFRDPETDADQRRVMAIISTEDGAGYYLDIFRSRRRDQEDSKHEYFYHNLGQSAWLEDSNGARLSLDPTERLAFSDGDLFAYDYLFEKRSVDWSERFQAKFSLQLPGKRLMMTTWMTGAPDRTIFLALSPPSRAFAGEMIPHDIGEIPLPTLIVQQRGEAWTRPFVALFEPSAEGDRTVITGISQFRPLGAPNDFIGIEVALINQRRHCIFSDPGGTLEIVHESMYFCGKFGLVKLSPDGVEMLFLGDGVRIGTPEIGLEIENMTGYASIERDGNRLKLSITCTAVLYLVATVTRHCMLKYIGAPNVVHGTHAMRHGIPMIRFQLPSLQEQEIEIA